MEHFCEDVGTACVYVLSCGIQWT